VTMQLTGSQQRAIETWDIAERIVEELEKIAKAKLGHATNKLMWNYDYHGL
jgi:hypothetical protein